MYKNRKKNYPYYEVKQCDSIRMMVDQSARLYSNKNAFCYSFKGEDKCATFSQFKKQVDALGTAMCNHGIRKSHIAILGDNSYFWILAYISTLASEAVVIPVDKELPEDDVSNILNHSDCDVLYYSHSQSKKLDYIKSNAKNVKVFILLDGTNEESCGNLSLFDLLKTGESLLKNGDTSYLDIVPDMKGLKQLVYTSGTTGKSKGVMLSQDTLCFNIIKSQELIAVTERCVSVLPYNHCYEATCGILTTIHKGMTICVNESLRTVLPNMKKYKPTEMLIVPLYAEAFYRRIWTNIKDNGLEKKVKIGIILSKALLKSGIDIRGKLFKDIHDVFGGEMLMLICGGAALKPHITEFFQDIGITLVNGYGITECGPLISICRTEYNNYASVGLPLTETEVKIYNPGENGEGEIIVKGRNVMIGYYKNQTATDEVLVDGYFHTGDIGKIDKNGFIYLTGRKKNVIVLKNGKNVYPEEIESVLLDIPYISEVVVYPAKIAGEDNKALGAEIFPNLEYAKAKGTEDVESEIKKSITDYNKKQPSYKVIKQVVFRNEKFEKTATEKIKRKYNY